jgi:4a-hydroxytetrahydrobiopterin dehydratase
MPAGSKLGDDEITEALIGVPGWSVVAGALHRELRFRDFSEAFAFMTRVAMFAEQRDHHPEWSNVYNRVVIDLQTHDAGGITQRDFELAAAIDRFVETA